MTHCEKMLRGCVVRRMTPTGLHLEAFFPVIRDQDELRERALRDMSGGKTAETAARQTG